MSSNYPNDGGDQVDGSKKVACRLVVASGNSAPLLEAGKEVLNDMARLVEIPVIFTSLSIGAA